MVKKYSSTFVKNNFGFIIEEVAEEKNTVVVEKYNKPVLKIKPHKKTISEKPDLEKYFGAIKDFPLVHKKRKFRKRKSL